MRKILLSESASFSRTTYALDKFKYQPEKIEKGVLYHYIKSNIDNSNPAEVLMYIASNDRIESFKIYPEANATYFVSADMDWDIFSVRVLEGNEIYEDLTKKLMSKGILSMENNSFSVDLFGGTVKLSVPVGHYPLHNYNFDFMSLNFVFRHLVDPEDDFNIGVHMLTADSRFIYSGIADIKYMGDDNCNGKSCRKYEISGEGMDEETGYIWVNKEKEHVENIEIPVWDSPVWNNFKFQLSGMEKMDQEDWNEYILSKTRLYFKPQASVGDCDPPLTAC